MGLTLQAPARAGLRRIALVVDLVTSQGRRVTEGAAAYFMGQGQNVELLSESWGDIALAELLRDRSADGVIATVSGPSLARMLREARVPVVNVLNASPGLEFPSVIGDAAAVGAMAAEHFLERGLRRLAVVTKADTRSATQMTQAFAQAAPGCAVTVHETPMVWAAAEPLALEEWLRSLPRPTGIFAVDDILARRVLQACRRLGIAVPEHSPILGVGDYELVNKLAIPPLSSVIQPAFQIGYRAAALLTEMLDGAPPPPGQVVLPPPGIVVRQSTDMLAVAEPTVAAAVRYIQDNMTQGLRVSDVAAHVSASRRWLERLFAEHLGRTPAEEIRRVQSDCARRLLVETDWPLTTIARACGLKGPERLSVFFKREVGMPPGLFRRQYRER